MTDSERLDKIINLLEANNNILYAIWSNEEAMVQCPKCRHMQKPDDLGYCQKCKADLKAMGVIGDKK